MTKDQSNEFKAYWLRDHFDLTTSAASIAWQAWQESRADMEPRIQQLMAKLADLLDEDQFAHCECIVLAMGIEPPAPFQGGLSSDELRTAFAAKLPNIEPTYRDLTVFALGVEVGSAVTGRIQSHVSGDVTGRGATSENAEGTPASSQPDEQGNAA